MSDPALSIAWKVASPAITRWPNLTTTRGSSVFPVDWSQLFAEMKEAAPFAGDMVHPGWAPASLKRCERKAEAVQKLCALVLDYDGGTTIDAAVSLWGSFFGFIHTSRKHKPEAPRFRVILPLSRTVSPDEHAKVWAWASHKAEKAGHKIDVATKDPARFWYWPGVAEGGTFETRDLAGEPIDVEAALADEVSRTADDEREIHTYREAGPRSIDLESRIKRARRYVDRMPAAISGSGGHQATWAVALVLVRGFDLPSPDAYSILADYNGRCDPPWNEKELRHKLDDAEKAKKVTRGFLIEDERRDIRPFVGVAAAHETVAVDSWPDPGPLPGDVWPVPTFDLELLPEALRGWIGDIAERAQCPIEYPAVGAIVSLGAIAGRRHTIHPKKHDDWAEVPNIWGLTVGPPGWLKSVGLKEAKKPLERLAARAREVHAKALTEHEFKETVLKAQRELVMADIKAAVKRGDDPHELKEKLEACTAKAPTERRYIINDSTVEKLGELLQENPNGLLLFRDEMMGWLASLTRDGHESDRAFYLEAWGGLGSFTYDRIGRGTKHIDAACVSILGGIQPGPLGEYLAAAVRGGTGDDGLVQRFQLLVYPDLKGEPKHVDRWPDTQAKNHAFAVFERVADESVPDEGWRFDEGGQAVFDAWHLENLRRIRNPEEAPVMASHLAKYAKLMPTLALLFELADGQRRSVSELSALRSVRWCQLLEAHARRVYQAVTERAQLAARALGRRIKAGKTPASFTARDIYRASWAGLTDREDVEGGIELLEIAGWLRATQAHTEGRSKVVYAVNPKAVQR